jgi:hypothetical protein
MCGCGGSCPFSPTLNLYRCQILAVVKADDVDE